MVYKLCPNRVRRAYHGGERIDRLRGDAPVRGRYPEDWIASCAEAFNPDAPTPGEGLSRTADGRLLRDIIAADPEGLLGPGRGTTPALLFKLLDSAERLVIQAHPTREFARARWNSEFGKTECWYMLSDGAVYLGFREGITRARWQALFERLDVAGMLAALHKLTVKKGELVFVAGGVPHAIGADCFLAELQEPTDLMVIPERVTPAGIRLDERKLHGGLGFEGMFDCFVYEGLSEQETRRRYVIAPQRVDAVCRRLLDERVTDQFSLYRLDTAGAYAFDMAGRYGACVVTAGKGLCGGKAARPGDTFFIDARTGRLRLEGGMTVLLCACSDAARG